MAKLNLLSSIVRSVTSWFSRRLTGNRKSCITVSPQVGELATYEKFHIRSPHFSFGISNLEVEIMHLVILHVDEKRDLKLLLGTDGPFWTRRAGKYNVPTFTGTL
jgi:hypothetical protein